MVACGSSGSDPDVDSIIPRHDETGIDLLAPLSLTFDEDITLIDPQGVFIGGGATGVSATLEADNRTITITHDPFLEANEYWWGIPEGSVQDIDRNTNSAHAWSFTTIEVGVPSVVTTTPGNGEVDIDLLTSLSITFDEDIITPAIK